MVGSTGAGAGSCTRCCLCACRMAGEAPQPGSPSGAPGPRASCRPAPRVFILIEGARLHRMPGVGTAHRGAPVFPPVPGRRSRFTPSQFPLAFSLTVAYNGKAAMKIGSCAILRREPGQVLTEAAVSVCWMCCGFAQSERYFFVPAGSENCTKIVFSCTSFGKCV